MLIKSILQSSEYITQFTTFKRNHLSCNWIYECSKSIPGQSQNFSLQNQTDGNHKCSWGHLCLSREAVITSETWKSLSYLPTFTVPVLAVDSTSMDSKPAEQGDKL